MSVKLSVVIPVFNEQASLSELVSRVERVPLAGVEKEVILVDDFSTDNSREILRGLEGRHRVFYHTHNLGKGAALRTGFAAAEGDIIIIQDADLELNPEEYPQLLRPLLADEADVVYGSRFLKASNIASEEQHRLLANKFLTFLSNLLSGLRLTDMETGYKVFKKQVLSSITLQENRFGFEPEVTAKIAKGHWRVKEIPITYRARSRKEGKKIGWKDGFSAIWFVIRYNLFK